MKNKIDYKYIISFIWLEYFIKYNFFFDLKKGEVPYCYLKSKEIHFEQKRFDKPTSRDVFDLLHEIGHLETNKPGMKRCEEEYYATMWAIEKMKKYDFDIPQNDKAEFQEYVWKWREIGIKHKAKTIPSKKQLMLRW